MKQGDIIEWKGVNITHRGVVAMSEDGTLYVKMDNGHSFPFNDISHSKSLKVIGYETEIHEGQEGQYQEHGIHL